MLFQAQMSSAMNPVNLSLERYHFNPSLSIQSLPLLNLCLYRFLGYFRQPLFLCLLVGKKAIFYFQTHSFREVALQGGCQ